MIERLQRNWIPGIRIQLMLWYMGIFVLLLFLTCAIFYFRLQSGLIVTYAGPLKVRTDQLVTDITDDDGSISTADVIAEVLLLDKSTTTKGMKKIDVNFSSLVRVLDAKGQTIAMTSAFRTLQEPSISVTEALQGDAWQGTVRTTQGDEVLLYSIRLMSKGRIFGVIQVGQSLTPMNKSLEVVVKEFLLIAPFVLILGAIGSYWLAARAFVPIRHLISIAEDISAGDLHRRVPVPRSRDEVQHLSLTFNRMITQLNKSFIQQRRFVADASHELRTPVAAIRSMTDVALTQPPNLDECLTVLSEVNAQAERLGWLIRDLLILARSDEGQVQLDQEPVRLDLLVTDVVATLKPLAIERHIMLQIQKLEPATVRGDASRLIQCVINLLDNALTYTSAEGNVTLLVENRDGYGCIVIQDTGIGIASEDIPHIFERFYRVDPARRTGGNGLGLSIVDWVIRAHEGFIHVESQVGQGSTFTLSIPLIDDP